VRLQDAGSNLVRGVTHRGGRRPPRHVVFNNTANG